MKPLVCLFRQSQTGKKARRLLGDKIRLIWLATVIGSEDRLQVLLGVSRRYKGKFTRQTLFVKKPSYFTGFIKFGQSKAWQSQACRSQGRSNSLPRLAPFFE